MSPFDRRLNRRPGFDYATPGAYFVTSCIHSRRHLLGDVINGELRLTAQGMIVKRTWRRIAQVHRDVATFDRFVVMPNHFHAIIILAADARDARPGRSISSIVGSFKALSARQIHARWPDIGPIWQRSFHDRIIRSERQLCATRRYIALNPVRWVAARVR